MTVIVGIVNSDGDIYMGGDSAGTAPDGSQSVFANKKVFTPAHGPFYLIGTCGSFRLAQVLKYGLKPPRPPGADVDLEQFMAGDFVDSVRDCYKDAGVLTHSDDGADTGHGGTFMVGYQGRLFKVEENFQVLAERRNYMAVGSGESVALGVLYATEGSDPVTRIMTAMKASAAFNAWVREPFEILRLPFAADWHQAKVRRARKKSSGKGK
jgi:hypothetical protein